MKKESYYFPHDCNARNDDKIIAVRMGHNNAEGYGVYFMILERLGESSDNMSVADYNVIAYDLRVSSQLVKSIVEDYGLFEIIESEKGKFFFSKRFKQYAEKRKEVSNQRAESGRLGGAKKANAKQMPSKPEAIKEKEKKEKKSTVKENKSPLPPSGGGASMDSCKLLFEDFRMAYPGSKRGLDTEWENFKKKNPDYEQILPLLTPAVEFQNQWREKKKAAGGFVPEWAHLQTWINQRRWEVEPEKIDHVNQKTGGNNSFDAEDLMRNIAAGARRGYQERERTDR